MNELYHLLVRTEREEELHRRAWRLAEQFAARAAHYDERAEFPFANFALLKEAGFLSLTVPAEYGGGGASLYELVLVQETLAQGDGATALSLGWHLSIVMRLYLLRRWPEAVLIRLASEITERHVLINSAHSERATGSPARGGKPETTAVFRHGRWVLRGRKTFASLAPALDYVLISATMEDGRVGEFLVPMSASGIRIEPTWNTLGMRATRSDDLVLEEVEVDQEALVETLGEANEATPAQGWLLHVPACYLGIAIAARNEALRFAQTYQPNTLSQPIASTPEVQRKIAEMEWRLVHARHFLYSIADLWDRYPDKRHEMKEELATAKFIATNTALEVVDWAMRIVGGQSLYADSPLGRYYRDVRAGLHNPPADDLTIAWLAKRALAGSRTRAKDDA
ncbi:MULTISPECIES: acyl-CoA dehydrogenase family protein [Geobacillus]|uniref:Butyryl-CoA dehydrogenase n=1 Tax=Geobacillus stearothermophilus TaxID=1422 RepID=A0A150N5W3_GEOSE|nr:MULTISPECIES: acyl-CoA dehydrogenase family protein [Geobacillus]KOR93658.1 acyl-CoA dehydrogenase [Geobacillus stearothermophilus ATCC 12980]KQC46149.1 acyl-CoA dehydrogenase [Geobacillus sp. Sah69]KYD32095.1 Butyryl-CoA dehydrogenase [Geobacillus stearothermophilus]MED4358083.1 acyl-CoA/acyl-ACP dehydrogenase [Geobacillus stearothermophilus]MED4880850.1 acyl-CoA/acyl-ACP dehydrogenase [Geobacillus stearothermophilus]